VLGLVVDNMVKCWGWWH